MTRFLLIVLLLAFLTSCSSNEHKRKVLMKYLWKQTRGDLHGTDLILWDTIHRLSDTDEFVVLSDLTVLKGNKPFGKIISVTEQKFKMSTKYGDATYKPICDR